MAEKLKDAQMKDINAFKKNRIAYIDIGSGIMITWMIICHALNPMWGNEINSHFPWLFFFMPWFFYKSGCLYKEKDSKTEWSSSAIKLLVPYVVWSIVGYFANIIWLLYAHDLTIRSALYSPFRAFVFSSAIPLNTALWFIPILFLVRGIGNMILIHAKSWIWVVVTLIASIMLRIPHFTYLPVWIFATS